MERVAILGACRTPFGRFGGVYREFELVELAAAPIRKALARSGLLARYVDQAFLGNCLAAATLGQVPGRQVAIRAGLPPQTVVFDVNTACTSALIAVSLAADQIRAGRARAVVAGGFESMSQVPYTLPGARFGYRLGHGQIVDALTHSLTCPITGVHMGTYASRAALDQGIHRDAQDRWALRSQHRYEAARAAGRLDDELVAVSVDTSAGTTMVTRDEQPRPRTTLEQLATLRPAFEPDGTVTAGNAPGLNDGAAALILAPKTLCTELGLAPLAYLIAAASVAGPPDAINTIPAKSATAALAAAGLEARDIDLWEINEAFAAVTLCCIDLLGLDGDVVNPNGGSIAIGHPVGATGARILMTLIYELRRRGGGRGLATICGAGSNGCAVIVEVPGSC